MEPTAEQLKEQAKQARKEAAKATARAESLRKEAERKEIEERRAKAQADTEAHYTRMYEEIGQSLAGLNEAQHGIVYSAAWEHGHSSGYSVVESYYGDFAEMARKLIEAN
jgi:membrane-bound lytic murein transglycosylase